MIRNVLEGIGGIERYPLFSLVLFVLVFAGMLLWVLSLKKSEVERASRLPLEDGEAVARKEQRI